MLGIIPCAGKGTRFMELGVQYPKAMLPYKEVPIIVRNIRAMKQYGCTQIAVVVHHQAGKIEECVKQFFPDDQSIVFVRQHDTGMYGLSVAIHAGLFTMVAHSSVLGDDVLIVLGDVLFHEPHQLKELVSQRPSGNFVTTTEVPDYERWCMVDTDASGFVTEFIDKPSSEPYTRYALNGIYYFESKLDLYEALRNQLGDSCSGEYEFSVAMKDYMEDHGHHIRIYKHEVLDFGTYYDYVENRGLSRCRDFNDVEQHGSIITKSSSDLKKIRSEYHWLNDVREKMGNYIPTVSSLNLFNDRPSYDIEFVEGYTLREMFLFVGADEDVWKDTFKQIFNFIDLCSQTVNFNEPRKFMNFVVDKTRDRYQRMVNAKYIELGLKEMEFVEEFIHGFDHVVCDQDAMNLKPDSLYHGDLCFSNIIWNRQDRIKVIDPRGELYGSIYYDVAKLCHSVIYNYDFVDAELYRVVDSDVYLYDSGKDGIREMFLKELKSRFNRDELVVIKWITASLFLSMIPLHYHNKRNMRCYFNIFKSIALELKDGDYEIRF